MNTFLATLRQDLFGLRWYLPMWIASLGVCILLSTLHLDANSRRTIWYMLMMFLGLIGSGAGVFGTLMFTHPVRDDRSGWRTRPLRPVWVGVEKLVLVLLLLVLPLACAAAWKSGGPTSVTFVDRWQSTFIVLLFSALFFTYLAAALRNSRGLIITLLILLCSTGLGGMGLTWLYHTYGWPSFSDTGETLAQIVYVVGMVGLILRQYGRPHLGRHFWGGFALFATMAVISLVLPNPWRPLPVVQTAFHAVTIQTSGPRPADWQPRYDPLADFASRPRADFSKLRVATPWLVTVKLDGFDQTRLWQAHLSTSNLRQQRGPGVESPADGFFPATALLAPIGLTGYSLDGATDPRHLEFGFQLLGEQPVTHLSGDAHFGFYFYRLTPQAVIACPLALGAHRDPTSGVTAEVLALDADHAEARVAVRFPDEDLFSVRLHGERAAVFTLLAVHDASRRAAVVQSRKSTRAEAQAGLNGKCYLLPRWEVPAAELRLVGVINTPDAHIYLPDVAPPQ